MSREVLRHKEERSACGLLSMYFSLHSFHTGHVMSCHRSSPDFRHPVEDSVYVADDNATWKIIRNSTKKTSIGESYMIKEEKGKGR